MVSGCPWWTRPQVWDAVKLNHTESEPAPSRTLQGFFLQLPPDRGRDPTDPGLPQATCRLSTPAWLIHFNTPPSPERQSEGIIALIRQGTRQMLQRGKLAVVKIVSFFGGHHSSNGPQLGGSGTTEHLYIQAPHLGRPYTSGKWELFHAVTH